MKLLVLADLHYTLKQFDWVLEQAKSVDAVLLAGDLLDLAAGVDRDVQSVVILKYLDRIRSQTLLLVSSGNHDTTRRDSNGESRAEWLERFRTTGGHTDGDLLTVGEASVSICPWWDGPVAREALAERIAIHASSSPSRPWIWIHHAPPQNSPVAWNGRRHLGDPHLNDLIERHEPDLVFSGHIHNAPFYPDGSWFGRSGRTWLFNPGRQIGPVPTRIHVDLSEGTASYASLEHSEMIRWTS